MLHFSNWSWNKHDRNSENLNGNHKSLERVIGHRSKEACKKKKKVSTKTPTQYGEVGTVLRLKMEKGTGNSLGSPVRRTFSSQPVYSTRAACGKASVFVPGKKSQQSED